MNLRIISLIIAASAFVSLAHAAEAPLMSEPVQVAQLTSSVTERAPSSVPAAGVVHGTLRGVLAAADKGPDALRRYVQRTRMIYGYRFEDFARAEWDR